MQRVRIGLTGLAGVFLLVMAAAAFFGVVRREPDVVAPGTPPAVVGNASAPAEAPKEPLAELGVTPGNLPETPAAVSNATVPPPTH